MTDTKENPIIRKFLDKLASLFPKEKEIKMMKVIAGTNKFWCKDKNKIEFWKTLAETNAKSLLHKESINSIGINITKVIYK